ncbi:MAG: hypothetical protein ACRC7C_05350, partial [Beijerinckiaceae bacterium]
VRNVTTPDSSKLLPQLISKNRDGWGITTDESQPDLAVPDGDFSTFDELIQALRNLGHEVRVRKMAEVAFSTNFRITEGNVWLMPVKRPLFSILAGSCYPVGGETGLMRHD